MQQQQHHQMLSPSGSTQQTSAAHSFPNILQLDLSVPSTSATTSSYDPAMPLDCSSKRTATDSESGASPAVPTPPPAIVKRKKISYAIEDLLKKDDS